MMKKLAIPLSLAAAAVLAGCAHEERVTVAVTDRPAVAVVSQSYVYPTGYIAVTERPYVMSYYTTYYPVRSGYGRYSRLRLTMQDNSVQIIDTNGPAVAVGAWVEVTPQLAVTYPVAAR